jgi:hypothetical protein
LRPDLSEWIDVRIEDAPVVDVNPDLALPEGLREPLRTVPDPLRSDTEIVRVGRVIGYMLEQLDVPLARALGQRVHVPLRFAEDVAENRRALGNRRTPHHGGRNATLDAAEKETRIAPPCRFESTASSFVEL